MPSSEIIEGTGGFVEAWLMGGDELHSGGVVPAGKVGFRIAGVGTELVSTPPELAELGQRVAQRWMSPLVDAVNDWAHTVGDSVEQPGMAQWTGGLTCNEVDVFARLLTVSGNSDVAASLLYAHAYGDGRDETTDGDEDAHYHILAAIELAELTAKRAGLPVDYSPAKKAAEDYVNDLTGRW
jgi:hypothetical protein